MFRGVVEPMVRHWPPRDLLRVLRVDWDHWTPQQRRVCCRLDLGGVAEYARAACYAMSLNTVRHLCAVGGPQFVESIVAKQMHDTGVDVLQEEEAGAMSLSLDFLARADSFELIVNRAVSDAAQARSIVHAACASAPAARKRPRLQSWSDVACVVYTLVLEMVITKVTLAQQTVARQLADEAVLQHARSEKRQEKRQAKRASKREAVRTSKHSLTLTPESPTEQTTPEPSSGDTSGGGSDGEATCSRGEADVSDDPHEAPSSATAAASPSVLAELPLRVDWVVRRTFVEIPEPGKELRRIATI